MVPQLAYCLSDVDAVFRASTDRGGREVVRCGWCPATSRRVRHGQVRGWFAAHRCVNPLLPVLGNPVFPARPDYKLWVSTIKPAQQAWEVLMIGTGDEVLHRGGRRTGFALTPEQVANGERVDRILAGLFDGGIPRGRAPRPRGGGASRHLVVVPLPLEPDPPLVLTLEEAA